MSISTNYIRSIIDEMVGSNEDTLRNVGGEFVAKEDETQTYHDSRVVVNLPQGVEFRDSRSLGRFGCEEGAIFESLSENKLEVTIDTDRGKVGILVKYS